eukprot:1961489-Pleurochrysis_carterae.AAC.1
MGTETLEDVNVHRDMIARDLVVNIVSCLPFRPWRTHGWCERCAQAVGWRRGGVAMPRCDART